MLFIYGVYYHFSEKIPLKIYDKIKKSLIINDNGHFNIIEIIGLPLFL